MPLTMETAGAEPIVADARERRTRRTSIRDRGKRIQIGLVNNMPDAALAATERQFSRLIEEASGEFDIRLSLFTLESLPRDVDARRAIAQTYRAARDVRARAPDALIVTGAEPRASELHGEPYWGELAGLADWAEARTVSSLFSCLAAHAAVLRRDRIARRRLPSKLSGVFASDVVADHELLAGVGPRLFTPHSRLNAIDERDLAASGYVTLTRSREAGVDIFVKEAGSLQVFLQGHPEYDADTLAREYRRDLRRFRLGQSPSPPAPPTQYFPCELEARMFESAKRATAAPYITDLFPPEALDLGVARWRATSVRLFRNWISAIARRKAASRAPPFAPAAGRAQLK